DSQGHASQMFGLPDENGLFAALIEKKPLAEIVREVPTERYVDDMHMSINGHLYVLPSSDLTYRVPYELQQHETFLFLEKLEELGDLLKLDVILIDTNPTLSLFDGAVYLAADGYIYVTECERLSMDGVQNAIEQMTRAKQQREKYLNRVSRIMGIIPNKMRPSTTVHRMNISLIAEAFPGLVWSPVTQRTAWVEAANVQESIFRYAPDGQEARDAWTIVKRTMEALNAE
ncbi:MAG: ParA family protein, partial [Chthonomonadales bacterium]